MKEVIDKHSKRYIRIEVIDPVTITTNEFLGLTRSFTSYLIKIETNHWAFSQQHSEVRRRFSEFCWLRSKLLYHHPTKDASPLPPKRYLRATKFDPKVIQERCNGLEIFLQRTLRSQLFLSDAALHLILQSDLTIQEIETKLHEEIKPHCPKRIHSSLIGKPTESVPIRRESLRSTPASSSSSSFGSFGVSPSDLESDRTSTSSGSVVSDNCFSSSPDTPNPNRIRIVLKNSTIIPGYVELNTTTTSSSGDEGEISE